MIGQLKTAIITYRLVPEISDACPGKAALQGLDQQLYFPGKTELLTIKTDLHHQAILGDDAGRLTFIGLLPAQWFCLWSSFCKAEFLAADTGFVH